MNRRPRSPLSERLKDELADLLAAVSHDLVGGIGGVQQLLHLLREDLDGRGERAEETLDVLGRGIREVQGRARLLQDLHRMSHEQLVAIDIDEVLGRARGPRDIEIAPCGVHWTARSSALELALDALLDNAVVHGSPPVEVAVDADTEWLWVHVRDGGPGIVPPEKRATALRPFTTYAAGGAGNGLAFVRRVAHLHGGAIELDDDGAWLGLPAPS